MCYNSKGWNRCLTVTKKEGIEHVEQSSFFSLTRNSRHHIGILAQKCPLSNKERQDLQPRTDRSQYYDGELTVLQLLLYKTACISYYACVHVLVHSACAYLITVKIRFRIFQRIRAGIDWSAEQRRGSSTAAQEPQRARLVQKDVARLQAQA